MFLNVVIVRTRLVAKSEMLPQYVLSVAFQRSVYDGETYAESRKIESCLKSRYPSDALHLIQSQAICTNKQYS